MDRNLPRALLGLILLAFSAARAAAAAAPASEAVYLQHGLQAFKGGNHTYSLQVFQYLTRIQPTKALYWFNLGNVQHAMGRHSQAILSYRQVAQLKSPLTPAAQLYMARSYRSLSRPDYAAAVLARIPEAGLPANLATAVTAEKDEVHSILFERGMNLYRQEKLHAAYPEFARASALKPGTQADLMKGMILVRLGRFDAAQAEFRRASRGPGDDTSHKMAEDLLAMARSRGGAPGDLTLLLDASVGYNDNLFGDSPGETLTARPVASLLLASEVMAARNEDRFLAISGWIGVEEVPGLAEERMLRAGTQATVSATGARGTFLLAPRFEYEHQGTGPYALRYGVQAATERTLSETASGGLTGNFLRSLALSSDSAFVTGYTVGARIWAAFGARPDRITAAWSLTFEKIPDLTVDSGVLPMSGASTGPGLAYTHTFSDSWQAETSATYLLRSFDQPSSDGEVRRDKQLSAALRLTHLLGSRARAYAGFNFVSNASTLDSASVDDKNYRQLSATLGVSWEMPH